MASLTKRQKTLYLRVAKRRATIKSQEFIPGKLLSMKYRKIRQENYKIIKQLRDNL